MKNSQIYMLLAGATIIALFIIEKTILLALAMLWTIAFMISITKGD